MSAHALGAASIAGVIIGLLLRLLVANNIVHGEVVPVPPEEILAGGHQLAINHVMVCVVLRVGHHHVIPHHWLHIDFGADGVMLSRQEVASKLKNWSAIKKVELCECFCEKKRVEFEFFLQQQYIIMMSDNFVQPTIPRFDGHYDHWSMLMENFLRSKEYWQVVESGVAEPSAREDGVIDLYFCTSEDQVADIMTKPLKLSTFQRLRGLIGVCTFDNS
ncbi:hypothetical protein ZIOFF_022612 [Zingiber officinale]|uniref:Uncharacterized protein n=1 Tax=Zingiber officinale TaxID=94328 RepID=A0A8J5LK91_ZINOF|nr:hypothetical protein ZIOFF_022612 [Zingiber officinale]